ncbi:hypothetical protein CsSME_00015850 [Camellia sinensis var. sinensis]
MIFLLVIFGIKSLGWAQKGSLTKDQCPLACAKQRSATSHLNNCLMFCNLCCDKCLCVPSGTYGHKEECPCYNNWKTKEGGPKCL